MKFGLHLTAACGLAAFLTLSAPASATTFTYNLAGDTNTAYTDPAWPGWTYIDLKNAATGSSEFPGYALNVGDIIQVGVTLNNPVTFNWFEIFLQETNDTTWIWSDPTYSYALGGVPVTAPSSDWWEADNSGGGLGFGGGFQTDVGTFSFDQVIVNAVITSLTDPLGADVASIDLTQYVPYLGLYNPTVATTPLPGALLLMSTALGGLGIFARRKRSAAGTA